MFVVEMLLCDFEGQAMEEGWWFTITPIDEAGEHNGYDHHIPLDLTEAWMGWWKERHFDFDGYAKFQITPELAFELQHRWVGVPTT